MKRTSANNKPGLKLKRKLQLVRTTIRELTPSQLEQVNGGYEESPPNPEGSCVYPYYTVTK
jgi:hypothetical protein